MWGKKKIDNDGMNMISRQMWKRTRLLAAAEIKRGHLRDGQMYGNGRVHDAYLLLTECWLSDTNIRTDIVKSMYRETYKKCDRSESNSTLNELFAAFARYRKEKPQNVISELEATKLLSSEREKVFISLWIEEEGNVASLFGKEMKKKMTRTAWGEFNTQKFAKFLKPIYSKDKLNPTRTYLNKYEDHKYGREVPKTQDEIDEARILKTVWEFREHLTQTNPAKLDEWEKYLEDDAYFEVTEYTLWQEFPQNLGLYLPRVTLGNEIDPDTGKLELKKNDTPVIISPTISLAEFKAPEAQEDSTEYSLWATISHRGAVAGGGHYVACINIENTWYLFDDASPTEKVKIYKGCVDDRHSRTGTVMAFYRRQ